MGYLIYSNYQYFARRENVSKLASAERLVLSLVENDDIEMAKLEPQFPVPKDGRSNLARWKLTIVDSKPLRNTNIFGREFQITPQEIADKIFFKTYNLDETSSNFWKFICWFIYMISGYEDAINKAIKKVQKMQKDDYNEAYTNEIINK